MKKYLDVAVPIKVCNFKCHYCYISLLDQFQARLEKFPHSVAEIRKALSKERWGDEVYINLCAGGETLLLEDSVELIRALLEEGHYIAIVTNGSMTKRFDEIVQFPSELRERIFFKFSYHYLELKRMNLFDVFFNNVRKVREAGCSFTIEVTPNDELIPYIDEMKELCRKELGAIPHNTIARDDRTGGINILSDLSQQEYENTWNALDSELFRYKMHLYHHKVKTYCYAGDWSAYINLITGDITPCNCGPVFGNIYEWDKPVPKMAMGTHCELPYCYNGHGWISMGVAPEEKHPVYTELRNRICEDGTEWITDTYKQFWQAQLFTTNKTYTDAEKQMMDKKYKKLTSKPRKLLRKIARKLHI